MGSTSRSRVVVARELPAAGLELLRERFDLAVGGREPDRSALLEMVRRASALIANPVVPVDEELLEAAGPSLEIVANFAVGYDNIDLEACRRRGLVVTNTPDVLTNATAELAVALMLAAARRIGEAERILRRGEWSGWEAGQLLGRELAGATIGIVGLGRIGTRVAELLQGFSPRILYTARRARPKLEARLAVERRELDDLLSEADVVTLHLPLDADTRHVIDGPALDRLKPGAILVNTSRGGLVDTRALIEALRSGRLSAAALDVYESEPSVPPELTELENVVLTPHVGSATETAREGMARLAAQNVISVLEGRGPLSPVR